MNRTFSFLLSLFTGVLAPTSAWEASVSQNVGITVTTATQNVTLSPSSLTFASQVNGTQSPPQTITATNTGTVSFSLASTLITGSNSSDFSQTNNCPNSLAVGAACQINVMFSPTAPGSRTGTVAVSATGGGTYTASLAGTGAAAGNAIPSTLFGMHYQGVYPTVSFGFIAKGSVVIWPYIQPTSAATYNWSVLDSYVSAAKSKNLPFIYTFEYVPAWTVSNQSTGCSTLFNGTLFCAKKPDNLSNLTNFMTTFLTRYCPSGNPAIQYFELYNEPYDVYGSTSYQLPPADLAIMTHEMYRLIKANCPAMKIVSPSFGTYNGNGNTSSTFISSYAQSYFTALGPVGTDPVDVASVHMYTNESGGLALTAEDIVPGGKLNEPAMNKIIATYAAGKPVWNTEGSWGQNTLTLDQEAGFIARWYLLHWSTGYVSSHWYQWENTSLGTLCSGNYPCAPISVPTTAYTQTYNWMVGRTMPSACSQSGTVWTCTLAGAATTSGAPCASSTNTLAVWNTAGSASYTPPNPSSYTKYCDLAGNTAAYLGGAVTIGIKPILLAN